MIDAVSKLRAVPLPFVQVAPRLLRSIALDCCHRLLHRRQRLRQQVSADYDQGEWRDTLQARRWEQVRDVSEYVVPDDPRQIVAIVDGRIVSVPVHDYYAYRTRRLVEILAEHAGDADELVEIGSGAGRNLLALAAAGRWRRLRGLDLSSTGIEVTRMAAKHFGLAQVTAEHIDLLDPHSPGFAALRGATAFTYYCLEQLPAHTAEVLGRLADAGVRRVIHIEPTPELFSAASLKDLASISYIWRQDYLHDLVGTARALEQAGRLRVLAVRRLGFAPTWRHDPTLLVWEPVASGGQG